MVTSLLDRLSELDGIVLLATMLLFAMGEATFVLDLIVPGEVAMVLGGAVLAEQDTPIVAGMAAAAIGAILGDSLSFLAGGDARDSPGRALVVPAASRRSLDRRAREYFGRRGGIVIVVGRFVGAFRGCALRGRNERDVLQAVPVVRRSRRNRVGVPHGRARCRFRETDRTRHRSARLVDHDCTGRTHRRLAPVQVVEGAASISTRHVS